MLPGGQRAKLRTVFNAVIAVIVFAAVGTPIFLHAATTTTHTDFDEHYQLALNIERAGFQSSTPHFLYHLAILATRAVAPAISPALAGALPVIAAFVVLGIVMAVALQRAFPPGMPALVPIALSQCLLLVSPLMPSVPLPYLIGYINPTVFHNPTQNILKAFALPLALLAVHVFSPAETRTSRQRLPATLLAASLVVLASLSKPSFTIVLVPGLLLVTAYRWYQRNPVDIPFLVGGIIAPATLTLAAQYGLAYTASGESGTALGLLKFYRAYISPVWLLPFMLLASIAFPLSVVVAYARTAIRSVELQVAWAMLAAGLCFTYFVHETGPRLTHGNFVWSGYIALFVLFFFSVRFLLQQHVHNITRIVDGTATLAALPARFWLLTALFVLHVLAGIRYYFVFLTTH